MDAPPSSERSNTLEPAELLDVWPILSPDERVQGFHTLRREDAGDFFLALPSRDQAALYLGSPPGERRLWARLLDPDDAADVVGVLPEAERSGLLALLDEHARHEVTALLAYAEDEAGGLMSPRFVRLRPDMRADEALRYLRKQAEERPETLRYAYVLEAGQRLVGVASLRQLFLAPGDALVRNLMRKDAVTVRDDLHQEEVARVMTRHNLSVVPVVDAEGCIKGIVTADDAIEVVKEAATEDMQKLGGMEALETSYLGERFGPLVRKRAGWLAALFLGEMLTATAMGRYEDEIARAVVLALFVPLIISSGGNSGSQATTLVIRAMALGEVKLRDWWRVLRRELASGLVLGVILAAVGLVRILAWQALFHTYGEHAGRLAATVAVSLVGVVMWGTLAGSMLPFALRRVGFDPASASAPFVATLVDVCGLIIYFNVASVILRGALLLDLPCPDGVALAGDARPAPLGGEHRGPRSPDAPRERGRGRRAGEGWGLPGGAPRLESARLPALR